MAQTTTETDIIAKTTQSPLPSELKHPTFHDLDVFLASLPDVTEEEADAFEQAIAENRAERRAITEQNLC